jgi:hypothetical protein
MIPSGVCLQGTSAAETMRGAPQRPIPKPGLERGSTGPRGRTRRPRCALVVVLLAGPLLGGNPPGGASPIGPTGGRGAASGVLDQLQRSITQPTPVAPRSPAQRPDMIWVPNRYVPAPGAPEGLYVPGHWERRLSEREFYVEPLVACRPGTSDCRTIPAGVRGPVETREGP